MKKIWQKNDVLLLKDIEKFTVGDDYLIDMKIVKYDIMGSIAHSRMLKKISILSIEDQLQIESGLKEIYQLFLDKKLAISYADEDVHTTVEKLLTENKGEVGQKLHTARSRNDQVLTDMRLFCKEHLLILKKEVLETTSTLLNFSKKYEFVPMCGYTHMQRAMPSSVGQWGMAFVEEFLDGLMVWQGMFDLNDMNPLGSGAGFGVSLYIDRDYTCKELGFSRLQVNPIYCQNSRGKVEAGIMSMISNIALACNKIATDLILFSTSEFAFFNLSDKITTGSSIMPQKKNLDVMELMRGRTAHILANESAIKMLVSNLISGYHRDLQDTKKLVMNSFDLILDFLKVVRVVFEQISPNKEKLSAALDKTVYATDFAYEKVEKGVPFRQAYKDVGMNLDKIPSYDPVKNIKSKKHIGSTGKLMIESFKDKIEMHLELTKKEFQKFRDIEKSLLGVKK